MFNPDAFPAPALGRVPGQLWIFETEEDVLCPECGSGGMFFLPHTEDNIRDSRTRSCKVCMWDGDDKGLPKNYVYYVSLHAKEGLAILLAGP